MDKNIQKRKGKEAIQPQDESFPDEQHEIDAIEQDGCHPAYDARTPRLSTASQIAGAVEKMKDLAMSDDSHSYHYVPQSSPEQTHESDAPPRFRKPQPISNHSDQLSKYRQSYLSPSIEGSHWQSKASGGHSSSSRHRHEGYDQRYQAQENPSSNNYTDSWHDSYTEPQSTLEQVQSEWTLYNQQPGNVGYGQANTVYRQESNTTDSATPRPGASFSIVQEEDEARMNQYAEQEQRAQNLQISQHAFPAAYEQRAFPAYETGQVYTSYESHQEQSFQGQYQGKRYQGQYQEQYEEQPSSMQGGQTTWFPQRGGFLSSDNSTEYGLENNLAWLDAGQQTTSGSSRYSSSSRSDGAYAVFPSREFRVGRVLKIDWPEPRGAATAPAVSIVSTSQDDIFSKNRRFIIVRSPRHGGHSICVPILTYGKQACTKRGVHPEHHGMVYTGTKQPPTLAGEPALGFEAIRMEPKNAVDKLVKQSRVNYAKFFTIEHNYPVCFVGDIVSADRATLQHSVDFIYQQMNRD